MSSTSQHTPGPWQITAEGGAIVGNEGGTLIVETGLAYWQNLAATTAQAGRLAFHHVPEVMANARLIAAAPDMLNLLTAASRLDELTGENLSVYARTFAALARAAISKATGQA